MIASIIAWSVRNVFLVVFGTALIIGAGGLALSRLPLDALPDLSDVQVIIYTDYPGQAPQVVEDQITYPLTTAMLSVPRSKLVRGYSFFGVSFVYIIFEDGTDIYWARSRVLEYLNFAAQRLPRGVAPALGPDATGVGWVYQYAVLAKERTLAELRTIQDWFLRYQLATADGVAEVAAVGGFQMQYQVVVDPQRLQAYKLTLARVTEAIRASNIDVGGRVVEMAETEYVVRGRGYLRGIADLEQIVLKAERNAPVLLRDVARVELGPDERRGLAELNGEGEVVAGIVVQRFGQNALAVIESVKERLAALAGSLPEGVTVEALYDRSELILRAVETLEKTLIEESLIVAVVCVVFLLHVRSALVAILMLPIGVLIAVIIMEGLGLTSNIMSLGGIAIAVGAMVDAAIVMIENAHKHLERASPETPRHQVLLAAAQEVGPSLFFGLLIITVSFLPVFTLEAQEGRLFKPLAFTKTFAMAGAAFLSITLVPVLMLMFVRGKILPEHKNPLNRLLIWLYRPIITWVLRWRLLTILAALAVLGVTWLPLSRLGSEFMPTLDEGTLLYMPTTLPGLSITKAGELLQVQDKIIKSFPEVASVLGKAGRAATATDPAPTEMFETVVNLKPRDQWRPGLTLDALIAEMDAALRLPGVSNAWTMPLRGRIDMLSTGIRTPVGVKVFGRDLAELERLARDIEQVVKRVPGTTSAYAERVLNGYYLDIEPRRSELARYGLTIDDMQEVVLSALGGEMVTTTVEGRERFSVNVRYPRDLRSDPQTIAQRVLVHGMDGTAVPLGQLATLSLAKGPAAIRTENALPSVYIFVDLRGRDLGGYVSEARAAVQREVALPPGYFVQWSGQFEYLERAAAKLQVVVPVTLVLIFLLLYLNFRTVTESLIVMLSVPFALIGGVWLMDAWAYNMSVAVAVGFIALAGVAAETGVVMLIYLEHALAAITTKRRAAGKEVTRDDLFAAVMEGAVERVRPKMMTVVAIMAGLLPILWNTGTGSEVMQRIALPMVGGMISSTLLTLIVIPAIYTQIQLMKLGRRRQNSPDTALLAQTDLVLAVSPPPPPPPVTVAAEPVVVSAATPVPDDPAVTPQDASAPRALGIALTLALALLAYSATTPAALAHEGHGHGGDVPPPLVDVSAPQVPTLEASSAAFELVAVAEGTTLVMTLDDALSNQPIAVATIEVSGGGDPAVAVAGSDGSYRLPASWLATPGRHELLFTVTTAETVDLLIGSLEIPAGGPGRSAGHAGAPARADLPRRLADGSVHLPKLTQHLLEVHTQAAAVGDAAATEALTGRVIADPNASGHVQAGLIGRIEAGEGGLPLLGQRVTAGEVLAHIVPAVTTVDRSGVQQQIAQVDKEIAIAEARLERLAAIPASIPQKDIDESRKTVAGLHRQREALAPALTSREALRAPISGLIAEVGVKIGQFVDSRDQVLFELIDPGRLLVEATAFDQNVGAGAEPVGATAVTADRTRLTLSYLGRAPTLRQQARVLLFRIDPVPAGLAVEQPVTVYVRTAAGASGILLPRASIVRGPSGLPQVWEHAGPRRFVPRPVRTRVIDADTVVVEAGVEPGARIVTAGAALIGQVR